MLQAHANGTRTAIVAGGRRKVATTFPDGVQLVEEYDVQSNELVVRKWKGQSVMGRELPWEFEIGDPPESKSEELLAANRSLNPVFCARDHEDVWEWRVRNLPYPPETYSVTVDDERQELVLRTTNRKYFKRWKVPTLVRAGVALDADCVSFEHANNTLVVQYDKPESVMQVEAEARAHRMGAGATL